MALSAGDLADKKLVFNEEFNNCRLMLLRKSPHFVATSFATQSASPRVDLSLIRQRHCVKLRARNLHNCTLSKVEGNRCELSLAL